MQRIAGVIVASFLSFSAMAQDKAATPAQSKAVQPPVAGASIDEITCACDTDVNGLFVSALDFIRKADKPGVLPLERHRLYGLAWKRFERIIDLHPDSWVAVRLLANQPIGGFLYWNFKRKYRLASVEACGLADGAPGDCNNILADHVAALVLELQNTENRVIQVQQIITRLESTFSTQINQLTQISQEVGKLRAEAAAAEKEKRDLLAQMAEIQSLAERYQKNLRNAAQKRREAETERDQFQALLTAANARFDEATAELVTARAQLEGGDTGIDKIEFGKVQGRLTGALNQVARLEARLKQANERVETLETRDDVQIIGHRTSFLARVNELGGVANADEIDGERIVFSSEVLFDVGKASLRPIGQSRLDAFAQAVIAASPDIPAEIDWALQIDGHTDQRPISTPKFPSNWELSIARSLSVVRYLIDKGIPKNRLVAAGHAEFHPRDTGNTEEAFQRNRRVEVRFLEN
ncbi:MAG: OmpA family protein [Minwuia sp.]|nr:OmpA family protein [Minwuia sp.]